MEKILEVSHFSVESQKFPEYNILIPQYNHWIEEAAKTFSQHSLSIQDVTKKILEYNLSIKEFANKFPGCNLSIT